MSSCRAASGRIDELTECLTLVQTGKSRKIPIILVGGEFWRGLIDWMRDKLVGEGMISATDLELMQIIEQPEAIVEAIFDYYENTRVPADASRARQDAQPLESSCRPAVRVLPLAPRPPCADRAHDALRCRPQRRLADARLQRAARAGPASERLDLCCACAVGLRCARVTFDSRARLRARVPSRCSLALSLLAPLLLESIIESVRSRACVLASLFVCPSSH